MMQFFGGMLVGLAIGICLAVLTHDDDVSGGHPL